MTTSLKRRLNKLERSAETEADTTIHSVRFVLAPEEARPPLESDGKIHLWGTGPTSWRVYVAPRQTREDALRAVGLNPDTDKIFCWG